MDRRKYILKRLEKELRSLGYEEPFLCREGESFIASKNFFKEAEKFKWIEKETENNIKEGEIEK